MKHAERKAALRTRDLIVIKLHGIDGAAAKVIILSVRSEDRTQQDAGLGSLGMSCETGGVSAGMSVGLRIVVNIMKAGFDTARMRFQFFSSSVSPHVPLLQS